MSDFRQFRRAFSAGQGHRTMRAQPRPAGQLGVAGRELEAAGPELKEAPTQLVQLAKMASLGELVAGVAHEVNNPLAYSMSHLRTIATALDAVAAELEGKLSEAGFRKFRKARARTEDVSRGLARVQELMTKLRAFSRLDEGTFKTADIRECVESVIPMVRHRLGRKVGVETRYATDNELFCAPGVLNQVVLNLLTNAIDAVGEQGRITISTYREEDHFCLSVEDSGPGVAEELRRRIFEPFFTTKEAGEGTGLGLAISHRIVERHRGRIDVGASESGGARFVVRIPADLAADADAA